MQFIASMPQQGTSLEHHVASSGLSEATSYHLKSASMPSFPVSATQDATDTNAMKHESDLIRPDSESSRSCDKMLLCEHQLIKRGRQLLQAYQLQKKERLDRNGDYDSREVIRNGPDRATNVAPSRNSTGEYSTSNYSSPKKRVLTPVTSVDDDDPSMDTKVESILPSLSPSAKSPLNRIVCGLNEIGSGCTPRPQLQINQQPLSRSKSERSWKDFTELLKTNRQIMDMVDAQLTEIWNDVVSANGEQTRGRQTLAGQLSHVVTESLVQKREAESAIAKLVEVLGSRVFLTGKMTDDAVVFVCNQLRQELEALQVLVERVKSKRSDCRNKDEVTTGPGKDEVELLLRQQLQDNEQQLQASQATIAMLTDQLAHEKKNRENNRQLQLEWALEVKQRELDALCNVVELPMEYERTNTTDGVVCYHRKGYAGSNDLDDPRVPLVLDLVSVTTSAMASAHGVNDEAISAALDGIASIGKTHRVRDINTVAPDYAGHDTMIRRSFSTPHITHDSNALQDIHVPPDDGRKHTIEDFSTPLPAGWEMRVTTSGAVFFFNKHTTATTWTDPRLLETAPTSASEIAPTFSSEMAPTFSSEDSTPSQPERFARDLCATTPESRSPMSNSSAQLNSDQLLMRNGTDDVQYIDVVFEDRDSIGIRFQANVPDSGASVESLLPDLSAAKMDVLAPYDQLVAVNKNSVASALFCHVMLLLQGGLRPLTLTFRRDLSHSRCPMLPVEAAPSSDDDSVLVSKSDVSDTRLDEEVVVDEGTVVDLEQLRVPVASCETAAAVSEADDEEKMNVADVIITNIFSLFWKPPETTGGAHTV